MRTRYLAATALIPAILCSALVAQAPAPGSPATAPVTNTTAPNSPGPPAPVFAPLLAQDVYKNIDVFRDKPATTVLLAMDALRHLLGVDCSWCHKLYEWDKEDLKPKQTARMMFHMQHFINTSTFDSKERINCWTCHRSQPIPATLPPAANEPPESVAAKMFIRFKPEQASVPVEKVFHNIKVLNGIPTKELPVVMSYFSRSLGVRCLFCHNLDDFASDEKPPKQTARKMLNMVQGISKNFYNGGDTPVQCYNCHQGHEKPPEGWGEPTATTTQQMRK